MSYQIENHRLVTCDAKVPYSNQLKPSQADLRTFRFHNHPGSLRGRVQIHSPPISFSYSIDAEQSSSIPRRNHGMRSRVHNHRNTGSNNRRLNRMRIRRFENNDSESSDESDFDSSDESDSDGSYESNSDGSYESEYSYDEDPDLGEEFLEEVSIPLPTHIRNSFPVIKFRENTHLTNRNCTICQMTFESDEQIRLLSCFDYFHKSCIDRWFRDKCRCPNCNQDLRR